MLRGAVTSASQDAVDLETVRGIVAESLNGSTSAVLASSALSGLRSLQPVEAIAFLRELRARLRDDAIQRFGAIQKREEDEARRRLDEIRAYEKLANDPHQFLNAFASNLGRGDRGALRDGWDIGIVTIISQEARAVQEWLLRYDPAARQRGPGHRYVYQATVSAGALSPRVVATQALDQGRTLAATRFITWCSTSVLDSWCCSE